MSGVLDMQTPSDGRDSRWDGHRHARRERLIASAIALIDRDGGDVGVAAIAAEAEIPRSVVYKLFRDREELDEQIRMRIIRDITDAMTPVLRPHGTVREAVGRAMETYVGWVSAHAQLHRFLGAGSAARPTHGSPAITGGKTAFARTLQDVIEAVMPLLLEGRQPPRGTPENLAYALIGLTDSVVNRWLLAGSGRSSRGDLSAFLTDAACGTIQGAARAAGTELDVDAVVV